MRRCYTKSLFLNQMLRTRFLYLVTCSFVISVFWMQLDFTSTNETEVLVKEALENVAKDSRYSEIYRKQSKLSSDLKYILLWTESDYAPFDFFEEGQRTFIKNNCSVINCYVTSNRNFFEDGITKFNAVAFNGRTMSERNLPETRSPHQKYIFFNMESADNSPVCDKRFDGFFNWTATYRLDSDIPFLYIAVKNKLGEIIGPQTNMQWPETFPSVDSSLSARLKNKTKVAAWFVSHCSSRSNRDQFVNLLQKALRRYFLAVDVYGSCGTLECPRDQEDSCNNLLEKDYFFYMALENSFAADYVTEKLLTALQHDTVPIVYGAANYSRFLPPGSYINSKDFDVFELATTMYTLMKTPHLYRNFFRWRSQYSYSNPSTKENICSLCTALNDNERFETVTVYDQFRKWWNPRFVHVC